MFKAGDVVKVIGPDNTGDNETDPDVFGVGAILVVRDHDASDKEAEYRCGYSEDCPDLGVWFPETSLKLVENT